MKILAIVVTYYPSRDLLLKNIQAFLGEVDKVLIWENTPISEKEQYRFVENSKVEYFGDGVNSISHGLNYAWRYAMKYGYDFLMTMDQDSLWYDFNLYKCSVLRKMEHELCICGPIACGDIGMKPQKLGFETNNWLITSGMLTSVKLIQDIGGYNENYTIDCVDIEFCLRANSFGYKSYYCYDGFLKQRFGTQIKAKFLWKDFRFTYYNAFRVNGILNGHLRLYRQYKCIDLLRHEKYFVKTTIKSILFVKQSLKERVMLLKALLNGVYHGLFS